MVAAHHKGLVRGRTYTRSTERSHSHQLPGRFPRLLGRDAAVPSMARVSARLLETGSYRRIQAARAHMARLRALQPRDGWPARKVRRAVLVVSRIPATASGPSDAPT